MNVNPITRLDYPDPDVIRVEDTYYMVSTTMHFMPGCEILQSFDLVHWEHATYVYETLDHTDAQQLKAVIIFTDRACGQLPCVIMKADFISVLWQMIPVRLICILRKK